MAALEAVAMFPSLKHIMDGQHWDMDTQLTLVRRIKTILLALTSGRREATLRLLASSLTHQQCKQDARTSEACQSNSSSASPMFLALVGRSRSGKQTILQAMYNASITTGSAPWKDIDPDLSLNHWHPHNQECLFECCKTNATISVEAPPLPPSSSHDITQQQILNRFGACWSRGREYSEHIFHRLVHGERRTNRLALGDFRGANKVTLPHIVLLEGGGTVMQMWDVRYVNQVSHQPDAGTFLFTQMVPTSPTGLNLADELMEEFIVWLELEAWRSATSFLLYHVQQLPRELAQLVTAYG